MNVIIILVIFIALDIQRNGAFRVVTVVTEKTISTVVGTDVTLTCTYSPATDLRTSLFLSWQISRTSFSSINIAFIQCSDNTCQNVITSSRYSITSDLETSVNLTISNTTSEDSSVYKCTVITPEGRSSSSVEVTIVVPPTDHFIQNLDSGESYEEGGGVLLEENTVLNLSCSISSSHPPPSNFHWKIGNNSEDTSFTRHSQNYQHGQWVATLQLYIQSEFLGESVSCLVEVGGMTFIEFILLNVTYAPRMRPLTSQYQRLSPGDKVSMVSIIESNPSSQIVWYKDGIVTLLGGRFKQEIRKGDGTSYVASLNISGVITPNDFMQYTCEATNSVGTRTLLFQLDHVCDFGDIFDVSATSILPFLSIAWNTSKRIEEVSIGTNVIGCHRSSESCQTVSLGAGVHQAVLQDIQACSVYTITMSMTSAWSAYCDNTKQVQLNITTPPTTPREMGIDVLYDPVSGMVKVSSIFSSSPSDLNSGVCFDLEILLIREWTRSHLCLHIGSETLVAQNLPLANIWVIACCMNRCSQASPVRTWTTPPLSSSRNGVVGPVVSVLVIILVAVAVGVIFFRRKSFSRYMTVTRKEKLVKNPQIKTTFRPHRSSSEYDQIDDITTMNQTGLNIEIRTGPASPDHQCVHRRMPSADLPELPPLSSELKDVPSSVISRQNQSEVPLSEIDVIKASPEEIIRPCNIHDIDLLPCDVLTDTDNLTVAEVSTQNILPNNYEATTRKAEGSNDQTQPSKEDLLEPEPLLSRNTEDPVFEETVFASHCQTVTKFKACLSQGEDNYSNTKTVAYENLPLFSRVKSLGRTRRPFIPSLEFPEQPPLPLETTEDAV